MLSPTTPNRNARPAAPIDLPFPSAPATRTKRPAAGRCEDALLVRPISVDFRGRHRAGARADPRSQRLLLLGAESEGPTGPPRRPHGLTGPPRRPQGPTGPPR